MPTTLASIHVYPVKSLGGFSIPKVRLTDRGLEHDRRWMLVDDAGRFLSQREVPAMACLHCAPKGMGFTVTDARNGAVIHLPWSLEDAERLNAQVWADEVELLLGDPTKARTVLGWNPTKTSFDELVDIMVKHDMEFVKKIHA